MTFTMTPTADRLALGEVRSLELRAATADYLAADDRALAQLHAGLIGPATYRHAEQLAYSQYLAAIAAAERHYLDALNGAAR